VLVLLAIPLSYVNPRMGRSFNLISGAFLYMVYYNCLNLVQSVIAQGKLSIVEGLVIIHSIAIAGVVLLFWNRLSVRGIFHRRLAGA
jgi:lipopolysaccharide export system permease protein